MAENREEGIQYKGGRQGMEGEIGKWEARRTRKEKDEKGKGSKEDNKIKRKEKADGKEKGKCGKQKEGRG